MKAEEFAGNVVKYIHVYGEMSAEQREATGAMFRSLDEMVEICSDYGNLDTLYDVYDDEASYLGYEGTKQELFEKVMGLSKEEINAYMNEQVEV